MNESLNNFETIKEYLLGRISDEKTLEGVEELLFSDDDFCTKVELIEDDLINDYVCGNLTANDKSSFDKTLQNNSERRLKVQVTQALKEKLSVKQTEKKETIFEQIKAFFRSPMYAGGFALLLITALIGTIFVFRSPKNDELAELKNIYAKERPIEPRISGFDYAPISVTRGENVDDSNKNKLKIEELKFRQAVAENPTAENHNKLGIFLLTQQNFTEAIKELQNAVNLADNNSKFHNDLGSAYLANSEKDKSALQAANEEFSKALELDPNSLEALFNKSLSLQKLTITNQAKESWEKYLQKDSSSKWADEARKNLEKIVRMQSRFKSKEKVLEDFLTAFKSGNFDFAKTIHNQTKGMHNDVSLPMQLARSNLEAKQEHNEAKIKETIAALYFIGNYELETHADFFVSKIANFYSTVDNEKVNRLLQAHYLFQTALVSVKNNKFGESIKMFEKSRDEFNAEGNIFANISELWAASFLQYLSKNSEGINRLSALRKTVESNNFKTIQADSIYWLANTMYASIKFSKIKKLLDLSLQMSENTHNYFGIEHCGNSLGEMFLDIGELERANIYAGKLLQTDEIYYQVETNFWRNQLLFSELAKKKHYYSTAIDFGLESLYVARKILPKVNTVNSSLRDISSAYAAKKQFDIALEYANESNQILVQNNESNEKNQTLAVNYLTIADIKSQTKNCADALVDYDKSVEYFEKLVEPPMLWLYQIHRGKLLCFQQLQKQQEFETELEAVLNLSEAYRVNIREDELRQSFFDNEQIVFDSAVANSIEQKDAKKAFDYLEISKARSLLDFVQSKKSISDVEKDFGKITKPLNISEIQSRLAENVQVFEYSVLPQKVVVWSITKSKFEVSEQAISIDEIDQKIRNYQSALLEKKLTDSLKQQANEIYKILFPNGFEKGKIICIVPDKSLYQLAFASLITNESRYLIEDSALFFSPSSSILVIETENAKLKESTKNETILSVGNPQFDRIENHNLQDLPEAETESKEIAKNYHNAKILIGKDATKSDFMQNIAKFDVIHFAGHYVANSQTPNNSKLLFADEDLKAFELAEKKLSSVKLVVLSACDTGVERFNNSEGAIGIARTFLALGTPIVLASGWKVDSEATKDLMINFHSKRRKLNISSVEALRQSQLEMLQTNEFKSPYFWSAFAVSGGFSSF